MKTDYLVLVNGDHRLPDNYESTVELITAENCEGNQYGVEKKTYEAFLRLQQDLLQNDGIRAELISGYRTIAQQGGSYDHYLQKFGQAYVDKYVARPGHSEHHTGLAIDVGICRDGKVYYVIEDLLQMNDQYKVIHEKLPRYGFILRYPKGKETETGIGYEPWHFRYVDDLKIAQAIAGQSLCLEEYHKNK